MDDDVDATEALQNGVRDSHAPFGGGDFRRYEQIRPGTVAWWLAGSGEDFGATLAQPHCHRLADPFRAARYQSAFVVKLVRIAPEFKGSHQCISNDAIRPDSTQNVN